MRRSIPEFNARERAEFMDVVGHGAQIAYVAVIPNARRETVSVVRLRMNGAVLGIDAGPTALGLQRTMRRLKPRLIGTRADAMRYLVEPVAQRLRSDLDRLKQNVVFWIARHTL